MIQFYLLSVVLNIAGGYALCADAPAPIGEPFEGVRLFFVDRTVRLVLGILMAVTGILKLLYAIRGDLPIVGDFLPAIAGVAGGLTLLIELYNRPEHRDEAATRIPRKAETLFMSNRAVIGTAAIITGVVHFAFPTVLFL